MMPKFIRDSAEVRAQEAYVRAYYEALGSMNRKDRRTAYGRQLVAEAKNKALLAKIAVLEADLDDLRRGAA